MNIYYQRIQELRELMMDNGWDAVILSSSDPHNSEYPAPRWQQMNWLSGFTGEAGEILITQEHAGLWTDSRYYIQAAEELEGSSVELHKAGQPGVDNIPDWIAKNLATEPAAPFAAAPSAGPLAPSSDPLASSVGPFASADLSATPATPLAAPATLTIALDGLCYPAAKADSLRTGIPGAQIESVPDLLSLLWSERPQIPVSPVITLSAENVGKSRHEKLTDLRKYLLVNNADAIFISTLDDIAWLLNIRGSDIEYNPYVISYLLVTQSETLWFAKKEDIPSDPDTADSFQELELDGITVADYDEVHRYMTNLITADDSFTILVSPEDLNLETYRLLNGNRNAITAENPVKLWKSIKNEVEIENTRLSCIEDGIAMETFLYWLENSIKSGQNITEWDASEKLTSLRAAIPGYKGNSFANISAYGPNAALPHYSVPEYGSTLIRPSGLYLVDSGGQYIFGTTDITRTIPMGETTFLEKEDYTLVLKGMIGLAKAVFPYGTAGCQLDILARNALWQNVRNFGHGTGHGIGFYLGVHEGPQSIRQNFHPQPIIPGMITSDEPGIYREGLHGVRHENMILCVEKETNEFGRWLAFETMTLCHIDTSAVIKELMTADEIEWLNNYNATVRVELSPRLSPEIAAWLNVKTIPL